MADSTIKPDSGNDLVLQNNGGGSKIEIPNSGNIALTGTLAGNVTVGSGKTLDVSSGTLTLANDQISGDKISGGTIGAGTFDGTIGNNAVFPAGHIINFNNGTNTRTSELTVSTSGTDHTDLSCNLTTTSTSNKMVVHCFLPGVYNNGTTYRSLHIGLRYSAGGGASVLGARSYITGFFNYGNPADQLIVAFHGMVTCAVPAVGTLQIFPRLVASTGDVIVYANASGTSGGGTYIYEEASIIAYEVKQ